MSPFPVILSAPSGGGKTTIARRVLEQRADVGYSVSSTTRSPRVGEVDGRDYRFISLEAFAAARGGAALNAGKSLLFNTGGSWAAWGAPLAGAILPAVLASAG